MPRDCARATIAHTRYNPKALDPLLEYTRLSHCPKCYSANVAYESGCSEPSCKDCGCSKCS